MPPPNAAWNVWADRVCARLGEEDDPELWRAVVEETLTEPHRRIVRPYGFRKRDELWQCTASNALGRDDEFS